MGHLDAETVAFTGAARGAAAAEIRARRAHKDITQAELASRAGVNVKTIQRVESGERPITLDLLMTLARVLEFSPAVFVDAVFDAAVAEDHG